MTGPVLQQLPQLGHEPGPGQGRHQPRVPESLLPHTRHSTVQGWEFLWQLMLINFASLFGQDLEGTFCLRAVLRGTGEKEPLRQICFSII